MAASRGRPWSAHRYRRAGLVAIGSIALALASVAGSNAWSAHLASGREFADLDSVPARSVAIVPGSPIIHGRPCPILADRLGAALTVYQRGRVRTILVSGNQTAASPEVAVMRDWLRARGVPEKDILTDEGGSRTRETMNRAAALFDVKDAVVCTQTVNMARTLVLARAAGIDAVGFALPTQLSRSGRYLAVESLKTTLAVAESALRSGPEALVAERARHAAIASR